MTDIQTLAVIIFGMLRFIFGIGAGWSFGYDRGRRIVACVAFMTLLGAGL